MVRDNDIEIAEKLTGLYVGIYLKIKDDYKRLVGKDFKEYKNLERIKFEKECHQEMVHKWLEEVVDIQSGKWAKVSSVRDLFNRLISQSGSP